MCQRVIKTRVPQRTSPRDIPRDNFGRRFLMLWAEGFGAPQKIRSGNPPSLKATPPNRVQNPSRKSVPKICPENSSRKSVPKSSLKICGGSTPKIRFERASVQRDPVLHVVLVTLVCPSSWTWDRCRRGAAMLLLQLSSLQILASP